MYVDTHSLCADTRKHLLFISPLLASFAILAHAFARAAESIASHKDFILLKTRTSLGVVKTVAFVVRSGIDTLGGRSPRCGAVG